MKMTSLQISDFGILWVLGYLGIWVFSTSAQSVQAPTSDPSPEAQLASFQLHDDFEINLFADESLGIANPIAMNWDHRGRLWVLTTLAYAQLGPGENPDDKLFILEDTDHDGRADTSKVFAGGLDMPTGFALGYGGVYIGEGANLIFLEDTDGDDKADTREVVLSGFGHGDTHQNISNLTWGPGGCLYFCQGLHTYSRVETPWGIVRGDQAGFWRFHPRTLKLEPFCFPSLASQNPCGICFDRWGAMFVKSNNRELIYVSPGLIPTSNPLNLVPVASIGVTPGKSMGAEYVGSSHLPDWIQNHILVAGYYSHRVTAFPLIEDGAGFARVEPVELLVSSHESFRPVEIKTGPDGAIYVADWFNPIIGHYQASLRHPDRDKEHGRIWRMTAKGRELTERQFFGDGVVGLFDLMTSPEIWVRNQAQRLLIDRCAENPELAEEVLGRAYDIRNVPGVGPRDPGSSWKVAAAGVIEATGQPAYIQRPIGRHTFGFDVVDILYETDPRVEAYGSRIVGKFPDWFRVQSLPEQPETPNPAPAAAKDNPGPRFDDGPPGKAREKGPVFDVQAPAPAPVEPDRSWRNQKNGEVAFAFFPLMSSAPASEESPRVWLETVVACGNFDQANALPFAIRALDHFPDDRFINYALVQAVHTLADRWLPAVKSGTLEFEKPEHLAFALEAYGGSESAAIARDRLSVADLPPEIETRFAKVLARVGTPEDLRDLLDRPHEDAGILAVLIEAWRTRQRRAAPPFVPRLKELIASENSSVRASTVALAGHWQAKPLETDVDARAFDASEANAVRIPALHALARLRGKGAAEPIAGVAGDAKTPLILRRGAVEALAMVDLPRAAEATVKILTTTEWSDLMPGFLVPFLNKRGGTAILAVTLEKSDLSAGTAQKLSSTLSQMGRTEPKLAAVLNAALGLQTGAPEYSPDRVAEIVAAVRKSGDPKQGAEIYRRAALNCIACHQIDGVGGILGPNLDTVGAGLPLDLIVESVLWPDRQFKEGYFAVTVTTKDGNLFTGYEEKGAQGILWLRDTATGKRQPIPPASIARRDNIGTLMPAGLTNSLTPEELRDLIAYLADLKGQKDDNNDAPKN